MAVYSDRPVPVPTPFQPIEYGGNPFLNQQSQPLGEYVPQSATPQSVLGSATVFNSGAMVPSSQVQTPPAGSTPSVPSGFNWDEYKNSGWNDYAAALADYNATGGVVDQSPSEPTPPPTTDYNIGGTTVSAPATPGGANEAVKSLYPESDYGQFASEFNDDPSAFFEKIDADYASQMDFLEKSKSALDLAKSEYDKILQADYELNVDKSGQNKQSALGSIEQNKVQAEQRKQDALATARQLYNDVMRSYQAKFGGRSTAAQAAAALMGREQQRTSAGISRDYTSTLNQLDQKKAETEETYKTILRELDLERQKQSYEALNNYQNNLRSIDADRVSTDQAKNQAKMQILMNLRDQQNQIALSNQQYKQQLSLMREEAQLQLDATIKQMRESATLGGSGIFKQFEADTSEVGTDYGLNQTRATAKTLSSPDIASAVGQIGYQDKDKEQPVLS